MWAVVGRRKKQTITIIIIIFVKSFHSMCTVRHPWTTPAHFDFQLSHWNRSTIVLCFLSLPLLLFATFPSAYLSSCIPEDFNPMQIFLLLPFLYVMFVQSNSIFSFYPNFHLFPMGDSPQFCVRNIFSQFYIHYSHFSAYLQCSLQRILKLDTCVTQIIPLASWSFEALGLVLYHICTR